MGQPMTSRSGLSMCAGGIAILCVMDAIAKAMGAHLTTFQIVFLRYGGSALWLATWIAATGGRWPNWKDTPRHLQRACLLVVTASMFFYGVTHLPLAIVAALAMTAPLYVTLLGALVFGEGFNRRSAIALLLGSAGSAVIVLGDMHVVDSLSMDILPWLAALLAPVTYAVTMVVLKHHGKSDEPAAMTFGQSGLAALLALPLVFGPWPELTLEIGGLAVAIGLAGAVGFLLLTHGLQRVPVSVFAVLDYTALLWAAALGFAVFGEAPSQPFWIGAPLILVACILNTRPRRNA